MIDQMVDRFLCWKLPKDFGPDAGISFKPTKPYEGDEYGNSWWPVGTNLLTADQAREMITHMLADVLPLTSFATEAEANAYMRGYCEHKRETELPEGTMLNAMLGWCCYRVVMAWPGPLPSGKLFLWMLAWAGDYAHGKH